MRAGKAGRSTIKTACRSGRTAALSLAVLLAVSLISGCAPGQLFSGDAQAKAGKAPGAACTAEAEPAAGHGDAETENAAPGEKETVAEPEAGAEGYEDLPTPEDPGYFAEPDGEAFFDDEEDDPEADDMVVEPAEPAVPVPEAAEQADPELDEGFFFEDGKLYYADESGEVRRTGGWFNLNGNTYYSGDDGAFYTDCDLSLGEYRFGFDPAGRLLIGFYYRYGYLRYQDPVTFERRTTGGWFTVDGKTYFSDPNGNLYHNRFIHTTETDYYWMSEDGYIMPGETVVVDDIPYDLDENGMVIHTGGWGQTADGRLFYKNPDTGMPYRNMFFDPDGGGECYAGSKGIMLTGWRAIEGKWMYFDRTTARRILGRFDEEALNAFNGQNYNYPMPGMSYGCCTGFVGFMTYNLMGIEDYPHTRSNAEHRNGGEYVDAHMIWLLANADMVGMATTENRKVVYEGETYQPGDIIVFNNRPDGYLGELSPGISSQNFDTWKVDGYAVLEHIAIVGWNTDGVPEGQYNMHHNTSSRNLINDDSPEQFILDSPVGKLNDGRSRSYYVFRLRPDEPEDPDDPGGPDDPDEPGEPDDPEDPGDPDGPETAKNVLSDRKSIARNTGLM